MSEESPDRRPPQEHKNPRKRLSRSSSRIVLGLLAALGLTILALLLFVPVPEEDGTGDQKGEPRIGVKSEEAKSQAVAGMNAKGGMDTAANYRPFPTLENLVGDATRRAKFRALLPGESVPRGTLVVFRWIDDEGGPWKVMILDNTGRTLREEEVKDPEYTLSSPRPGLYYWTVAREDKIRHVGRVAVR
jgi:hypothetical protein